MKRHQCVYILCLLLTDILKIAAAGMFCTLKGKRAALRAIFTYFECPGFKIKQCLLNNRPPKMVSFIYTTVA